MSSNGVVHRIFRDLDREGKGYVSKEEFKRFAKQFEHCLAESQPAPPPPPPAPAKESKCCTDGPKPDYECTSEQEAREYLRKCWNLDLDELLNGPKTVISKVCTNPVTFEQRVHLQCYTPPRPPPSTQPKPIIIHVRPPPIPAGSITLREQPPRPESYNPKPSVTIKRYSPEKRPDDITIERWCPYPPPADEPKPTLTIVNVENSEPRIVRKVKKHPLQEMDPEQYEARHGSSLFSREDLLNRARQAGVADDIECECHTYTKPREKYRPAPVIVEPPKTTIEPNLGLDPTLNARDWECYKSSSASSSIHECE